tara:strand:+ start:683 stop:1546 length:864 start_codon:yes stop_codon:yes gene_type:complete
MPELPEVEIVKRSLKNKIYHKKINKIIISNRNLRFKIQKNFEKILKYTYVTNIYRFSKYIILEFKNKKYCIIHLGMSGTLHLVDYKKKKKVTNLSFYKYISLPKKHNHIKIKFDNFMIVYNDPRRFGFFKILNSKSEIKNYFKQKGPDALTKKFNKKYLEKKLVNIKKNIKNCLLDQNIVSGIGNIYSNEILFYSKIDPLKLANKLNKYELYKIVKYSKIVLNLAIKLGGSSIRNFKSVSGKDGYFQDKFKVYDQHNKKCSNKYCDDKILKIFVSNRSTFLCKSCQK